jgi:hypothetical protein
MVFEETCASARYLWTSTDHHTAGIAHLYQCYEIHVVVPVPEIAADCQHGRIGNPVASSAQRFPQEQKIAQLI